MSGMLNFLTKSRVVFNDIYILYIFIYFIYDVVPTENLTKKRDSSLTLTLTLNFEDDREQFLESPTNILPPESFLEPWLRYEAIHSHFPPTVGEAQFTKFLSDCLLAAKWIEMCVLFFVSVFSRAVGVFVFWDTTSWTILNDFKLKGCRADTPNSKCLDGAELHPKGAKRRKTYLVVLYVFRKMYAALERASCGQNISKEADYSSNTGYS